MSKRSQSKESPGTKSLSFGVVPSADPRAPLGRDRNDKPIVPMRTDRTIVAGLLERPDLAPGKCHHKNDPSNCIQCRPQGVKPQTKTADQSTSRQWALRHVSDPLTPEEVKAEHNEVLEENARRMLKTPNSKPLSARVLQASAAFDSLFGGEKAPVAPAPKKLSSWRFDCYRELLMMERDTIVDLFDLIVEYIRPEKPPEGLVERLQKEITELDALILTRSAAWQKRHRIDDRLEKNDRERLKRQERTLRDEKKKELLEARSCLRRWQETPPVPMTFGDKFYIAHRSFSTETKFKPDIERTPKGWDPYYTEVLIDAHTFKSGVYDIHGYKNMLKLGIAAWGNDDLPIDGWVEWENKVILQAIKCGLIKPNVNVLKNYPGLDVYQRPLDPIVTDHTAENTLIIKTGAAQISGSVRGAGYTGVANNTKRALTDFTAGPKNKGGNAHPGGAGFVPDFGGDSESYQPE